MKLAAVDLGSNSLRLVVANYNKSGNMEIIHRELKETRLGEGLQPGKNLHPRIVERNLVALKEFRDLLVKEGVHLAYALGTSALREAGDGQDFLKRIEAEVGFPAILLSSKEEAYLGFFSTSMVFSGNKRSLVVLDAGGRSTELSWQQGKRFLFRSLPLGAVILQEAFFKKDPPDQEELLELENYLNEHLLYIPRSFVNPQERTLVGIGGTITTLAAVHMRLDEYIPHRVHGQVLTTKNLENIIECLISKPLSERIKVPGLPPKRADIIIPGAIAFLRCMERMGFDKLLVNQGGYLLAALRLLAQSFAELR